MKSEMTADGAISAFAVSMDAVCAMLMHRLPELEA